MNPCIPTPDSASPSPGRIIQHRLWFLAMGAVLAVILSGMAWRSLNFFSYHRFYTDSGVFAAVTQHLLAGKTLYREVWDHKPPMIYVIDSLPLALGDASVNAIRYSERFYAVAGILAIFFSLWLAFQNPWLAFVIATGFHLHFYDPEIFQGGNLTEEYGAVFVLIGIFLALAARLGSSVLCRFKEECPPTESIPLPVSPAGVRLISRERWCSFFSGFFFSLAVFTKEPFLLSVLPWMVFLALPDGQAWKSVLRRVLVFILGFAFPVVVFFAYFIWNGILWDWLDVLTYNVQYSLHSRPGIPLLERVNTHFGVIANYILRQSWTFLLLFLIGLAGCAYLPLVKKYQGLP